MLNILKRSKWEIIYTFFIFMGAICTIVGIIFNKNTTSIAGLCIMVFALQTIHNIKIEEIYKILSQITHNEKR